MTGHARLRRRRLFRSRRVTPCIDDSTIRHWLPPMKQIRHAAVRDCHHDGCEFGDTVLPRPSPQTGLAMLRSFAAVIAFLGSLVVPAAAQAAAAQRMPGDGERAAARDAGQPPPRRRQGRRSRDHLCRPFDLLHRHARRRADRDRFQRRLPDRPPARRRHHEPRAQHALHAVSRSEDSACPARLGRERTARAYRRARSATSISAT